MVNMPPRHGKQIADSIEVMTTRGFKRHGDLQVGDQVFSPSGKPIPVVAVSEPSKEKVKVNFTDGSSIVCHPNHEWLVYDRGYGEYAVLEAGEMARQALWSGDRARFQVDHPKPLDMPEADLPVDPYALGVWLGDGTSGSARICGTPEDVAHYRSKIPHQLGYVWTHPTTGVEYQYYKGISKHLRALGVFKDKHIPESYLVASEAQRRALLAGIVDTDGHVDKGGRIRVLTVSDKLAEGVKTLVRTLGYKVTSRLRPIDVRDRKIKSRS